MVVHSNSLAATLDAANAVLFAGRKLPPGQQEELARWLAGRQWQAGPYAGLFAPTEADYQEGVRLFTGEPLRTKLAARSVLSAEAARLLALLGLPGEWTAGPLRRVRVPLLQACYAQGCAVGECAHAQVALMRYLALGEIDDAEQRLAAHLLVLVQHRDGRGRWKRFPFYYTLLTLSEIDLAAALAELRYAAPAAERCLERSPADGPLARRRRLAVQRALARG
jgi:hypothetical protein